ncbi:MAG: hypothetical protein JWL62_2451, partial [Hyphomicrobiales bacterium]|nr:hypothetical protein [Hyphomicrobiales bacterium]
MSMADQTSDAMNTSLVDLIVCKVKTDDKDRLACFDAAAKTASAIMGQALLKSLAEPD